MEAARSGDFDRSKLLVEEKGAEVNTTNRVGVALFVQLYFARPFFLCSWFCSFDACAVQCCYCALGELVCVCVCIFSPFSFSTTLCSLLSAYLDCFPTHHFPFCCSLPVVCTPPQKGSTALMFAAWKGYTKIAELLVEKGAQVNIKNYVGVAVTVIVRSTLFACAVQCCNYA
jgi:hypothetical protein